jgi:PAS domain S-box-containing protein
MNATQPAQTQAQIFVVDDTPANLQFLLNILAKHGYDVQLAEDGRRALHLLQTMTPDLILLDIKMPNMSGFEVCTQLKANGRTAPIPIIFLSALDEIRDKAQGFAVGGVDYITKPFQVKDVLARVETHLTLARLRQHLEDMVAERTAALQQEIQEHQHAEIALRKSEEQYRLLVENVTDGIGILQAQRIVFANAALAILLGYPPEQLYPLSPSELFQTADFTLDQFQLPGEASINAPPWRIQQFPVRQTNREIWLEGRYSDIQWEGHPALLVVLRDITEQRQKEVALTKERQQLLQENLLLRATMKDRYRFGDLIGRSPGMQAIYELITKVATTDASVLISGESGTGKDLIAQTIHQLSARRAAAFVPVNCGSIPEALCESEFFGYRKGAFTGAWQDKPGLFAAAQHGTLFLDEVSELSAVMQVKLLRALDGQGYTPVGSQISQLADVRIVAATNRDVKTLVNQGVLREDFFYRLNVIQILVPPLRERREDIPLLVDFFLAQYAPTTPPPPLLGHIAEALYRYDWPGNIRQLQNVLQRYVMLNILDFDDQSAGLPTMLPATDFWQTVGAFEKQLIQQTLAQQHGHKTRTAAQLNIPLRTLRRKMQQYGLTDDD